MTFRIIIVHCVAFYCLKYHVINNSSLIKENKVAWFIDNYLINKPSSFLIILIIRTKRAFLFHTCTQHNWIFCRFGDIRKCFEQNMLLKIGGVLRGWKEASTIPNSFLFHPHIYHLGISPSYLWTAVNGYHFKLVYE